MKTEEEKRWDEILKKNLILDDSSCHPCHCMELQDPWDDPGVVDRVDELHQLEFDGGYLTDPP